MSALRLHRELAAIWATGPGVQRLAAVNHSVIGLRFMATDWFSVNIALINQSYVDQPAGSVKGSIQNILALNAGVSIFIPFRSTGRESE